MKHAKTKRKCLCRGCRNACCMSLWHTMSLNKTRWAPVVRRNVRYLLGCLITTLALLIFATCVAISSLFYKEFLSSQSSSNATCTLPTEFTRDYYDSETGLVYNYLGFKLTDTALTSGCALGGKLHYDLQCSVECNNTVNGSYLVRDSYNALDFSSYETMIPNYQQATWSCENREPSLTCLTSCQEDPITLIANASSEMSSCAGTKHAGNCAVKCDTNHNVFDVSSTLWCVSGIWSVCSDTVYTSVPEVDTCVAVEDMTSSSMPNGVQAYPICQEDCVSLSALATSSGTDLSSVGYRTRLTSDSRPSNSYSELYVVSLFFFLSL
jgi:hypothetical protein